MLDSTGTAEAFSYLQEALRFMRVAVMSGQLEAEATLGIGVTNMLDMMDAARVFGYEFGFNAFTYTVVCVV